MNVISHVAQNKSGRNSAVPDAIAQSEGYSVSQQNRKLIEQGFGWAKTEGGMRQVMVRGIERVDQRICVQPPIAITIIITTDACLSPTAGLKSMGKDVVPQESGMFPTAAQLAALRGWYAGMSSRACVVKYLNLEEATRQSSRRVLGDVRRQLSEFALARHRPDLAELMDHDASPRTQRARAVLDAIEVIRRLP